MSYEEGDVQRQACQTEKCQYGKEVCLALDQSQDQNLLISWSFYTRDDIAEFKKVLLKNHNGNTFIFAPYTPSVIISSFLNPN